VVAAISDAIGGFLYNVGYWIFSWGYFKVSWILSRFDKNLEPVDKRVTTSIDMIVIACLLIN
jgi:hypothetical protein